MRIRFWGTRGSLATPGPDTIRYGGNTSCVEVREEDTLLILDAGTGIRPLGDALSRDMRRVDLLLTHLHMDHIQGLGFFDPLFWPELEVHVWGPSSTTLDLHTRLSRYLSPPLFPVRLRDLPCQLYLHDAVAIRKFEIGPFSVEARLVCHPGPTVGYRITSGTGVLTYLPDHEPTLGIKALPSDPAWIPGIDLALGADILIHDAQFSADQYPRPVNFHTHPDLYANNRTDAAYPYSSQCRLDLHSVADSHAFTYRNTRADSSRGTADCRANGHCGCRQTGQPDSRSNPSKAC